MISPHLIIKFHPGARSRQPPDLFRVLMFHFSLSQLCAQWVRPAVDLEGTEGKTPDHFPMGLAPRGCCLWLTSLWYPGLRGMSRDQGQQLPLYRPQPAWSFCVWPRVQPVVCHSSPESSRRTTHQDPQFPQLFISQEEVESQVT